MGPCRDTAIPPKRVSTQEPSTVRIGLFDLGDHLLCNDGLLSPRVGAKDSGHRQDVANQYLAHGSGDDVHAPERPGAKLIGHLCDVDAIGNCDPICRLERGRV